MRLDLLRPTARAFPLVSPSQRAKRFTRARSVLAGSIASLSDVVSPLLLDQRLARSLAPPMARDRRAHYSDRPPIGGAGEPRFFTPESYTMSFTDDCQDTDFRAYFRRSEDTMMNKKETETEPKEAEKKEANERPIGYFQLDVQELGTEFTATPEGE